MRRSLVTVGLAVLFGASIAVQAQAQTAPAAPAAAPQQAPPDPLRFTTDDAAVVIQVVPAKAADFEAGWKTMSAALAASDNPELKATGASMTLRKCVTCSQPTAEVYVLEITGVVKTVSYNWGKLIYYAGKEASPDAALLWKPKEGQDALAHRTEIDNVFKQINDSSRSTTRS
jgi:hypothetical protein